MKHAVCMNDTMLLDDTGGTDVCSTPKSEFLSTNNANQYSFGSYSMNLSKNPLHVEVCVSSLNCQEFSYIESQVVEFLRCLGPRHLPTVLTSADNDFNAISGNAHMDRVIEFLNISVTFISVSLCDLILFDFFFIKNTWYF